ncbi:MAG: STAS domain-containing protein [Actinobacteria bacterium]|nr:STAS domain-containing protein [Actinomycetota bacterium]
MLSQIEERFDGPLTIERTRFGEDVIVISLSGELDLASIPLTEGIVEPAMTDTSAMVVVDLTELEFLGVKGVHLLYGLAQARPDEDSLRLVASRHIGPDRVLRLTGIPEAITTIWP